MAYCEGGDLQQRLQRVRSESRRLQEKLVLNWFDQLCSAVAYVHYRQVLHRDLKPSNVFLSGVRRSRGGSGKEEEEEESVALGDFGVSRPLAHALELATTMVGTPCYLSPEVCRGKPYSFKSDVWSLGCVLFEMMVLRPPFGKAPNLEVLVSKIVRADYAVPKGLAAEYPEALRCTRAMLRLEPERRPTAQALENRTKANPTSLQSPATSVVPIGSLTATTSQNGPLCSPNMGAPACAKSDARCSADSGAASPKAVQGSSVSGQRALEAAKGESRARLANRILEAEAAQKDEVQVLRECDPSRLAFAPKGRQPQGQQLPRATCDVHRRARSQGPKLKSGGPQPGAEMVVGGVASPRPECPFRTPREVVEVRCEVVTGGACEDARACHSPVRRRRSVDARRSGVPQDEDTGQHHGGLQAAPKSPVNGARSPRAPPSPPALEAEARVEEDSRLRQRREDRVQQSQAFREWLRCQRAGGSIAAGASSEKRTEIYCPGFPVIASSEDDTQLTAARQDARSPSSPRLPLHSAPASPELPGWRGCFAPPPLWPPNRPGSKEATAHLSGMSASMITVSSAAAASTPAVKLGSAISEADSPWSPCIWTPGDTSIGSALPQVPSGQSSTGGKPPLRVYHEALAPTSDGACSSTGIADNYDEQPHMSIGDRIEGIRACLEARMGTQRFQTLYTSLVNDEAATDPDATMHAWSHNLAGLFSSDLDEILEKDSDHESGAGHFAPLVAKLVACERGYFS